MDNDGPIEEIKGLANYLNGFAAAVNNESMDLAAEWLTRLADHICVGGVIGCSGGADCTSDHK